MDRNLAEYRSKIADGNYITLDPGARLGGGTGVAIFKNFKLFSSKVFSSKLYSYDERVDGILKKVFKELPILSLITYPIFIERPQFFDTNKGLVAAKSDSLFKLIYFYGRLFQICTMINPTYHLEIVHWKGQLSKEQVTNRVYKVLPDLSKNISGDEIDAIGMGLYLNGSFQ